MRSHIVAALLALPLALSACEEPKDSGTKVQANVTLPEPPQLPALPVAAQYENSIYSVAGIKRALLLHRGKKVFDTDQTIRAMVVEHYPNPCPKAAKDCLGKKPHFFISDSMDGKQMTIVPNWEDDGEKLKKAFEVGKTYDFQGKFSQNATNGFTDAGGLLDTDRGCYTSTTIDKATGVAEVKCYPEIKALAPGELDPTGAPPKRATP